MADSRPSPFRRKCGTRPSSMRGTTMAITARHARTGQCSRNSLAGACPRKTSPVSTWRTLPAMRVRSTRTLVNARSPSFFAFPSSTSISFLLAVQPEMMSRLHIVHGVGSRCLNPNVIFGLRGSRPLVSIPAGIEFRSSFNQTNGTGNRTRGRTVPLPRGGATSGEPRRSQQEK